MIELSPADSQIVLYAKGHFGHRDFAIEDLRTLVANRAGMSPAYITNRDIVIVLMMLLEKLRLKFNGAFIESIIFGNHWQHSKGDPLANFLCSALALMSGMPVLDRDGSTLVKLHPLDPNALTKTEGQQ